MQDRRRSFRATSADGVGTWGFRLDDDNAPTAFRIGKKRSGRVHLTDERILSNECFLHDSVRSKARLRQSTRRLQNDTQLSECRFSES